MAFGSAEELNQWLEALQAHQDVHCDDNVLSPKEPQRFNTDTLEGKLSPAMKPELSQLPSPGHAELKKSSTLPPGLSLSTAVQQQQPRPPRHSAGSKVHSGAASSNDLIGLATGGMGAGAALEQRGGGPARLWSGYSLRPYPPCRGNFTGGGSGTGSGGPGGADSGGSKAGVKMRQKGGVQQLTPEEADDAQILKVVEAYCAGGGNSGRHMIYSTALGEEVPQVLLAEEEKLIIEERIGDETVVRERTLVDTVYDLKDQVDGLRGEVKAIAKLMEKEQRARRKLEASLRRSFHRDKSPLPAATAAVK